MNARGVIAGGLAVSVIGVAVLGEEKIHADYNVPAPVVTSNQMVSNATNTVAILRGFGPLDYATVGTRLIREVKG
jgi:hypothetical protein